MQYVYYKFYRIIGVWEVDGVGTEHCHKIHDTCPDSRLYPTQCVQSLLKETKKYYGIVKIKVLVPIGDGPT